jgi:putative copper resistance protein D
VEPAWQKAGNPNPDWIVRSRRQIAAIVLFGLLIAVLSGAVLLFLVAAVISNESWVETIGDGIAWTVLTHTQFGRILQMRAALALCLTGLLLSIARRRDWSPGRLGALAMLMAVFFLALLAWIGHAGGALGRMHLLNDVAHLLAAGAWLGGLIPLRLILGELTRTVDGRRIAICGQVLSRFSNLDVVTVLALFTSGFINARFLTDGMRGLVGADYGRLVLVKIALFIAMFFLAAVNRLDFLPRLLQREGHDLQQTEQLRQLRRNTAFEIALGLVAIYIVGILGVTPPAGRSHGTADGCRCATSFVPGWSAQPGRRSKLDLNIVAVIIADVVLAGSKPICHRAPRI